MTVSPLRARRRAALLADRHTSDGAGSFSWAMPLLDRPARRRLRLLRDWCRRCEALADAAVPPGAVNDGGERLAEIRRLTDSAFAGQPTGDAAFDGLATLVRECGLSRDLAEDVIVGCELDARTWRPRSEADLARYCYHAAGAVAVLAARVVGVRADDAAMLDRAFDAGVAIELADIARDFDRDDRFERCYLPVEWLVEEDIEPGQQMKPHHRQELADMAARLIARMERHAAWARSGAAALPLRQRWAVLSALAIAAATGRRVAELGPRAWDEHVTLSAGEKLRCVAGALREALRPGAPPPTEPPAWQRRALQPPDTAPAPVSFSPAAG